MAFQVSAGASQTGPDRRVGQPPVRRAWAAAQARIWSSRKRGRARRWRLRPAVANSQGSASQQAPVALSQSLIDGLPGFARPAGKEKAAEFFVLLAGHEMRRSVAC